MPNGPANQGSKRFKDVRFGSRCRTQSRTHRHTPQSWGSPFAFAFVFASLLNRTLPRPAFEPHTRRALAPSFICLKSFYQKGT